MHRYITDIKSDTFNFKLTFEVIIKNKTKKQSNLFGFCLNNNLRLYRLFLKNTKLKMFLLFLLLDMFKIGCIYLTEIHVKN